MGRPIVPLASRRWLVFVAVLAGLGLAAFLCQPSVTAAVAPASDADVLFREALRRGYALDDLIVRRQLVRRMRDTLAAEAGTPAVDDAALAAWLDQHPASFQKPARYSFDHVYLSRGTQGAGLAQAAAKLALRLRQSPEAFASLGDPFPQGNHLDRRDAVQVESDFGHALAEALPGLPAGQWQGPVESPLGLHFLRITAIDPARRLTLDEARPRLRIDYLQAERQQRLREAIARLRQNPDLTLPLPTPARLPDED